MELGSVLVTGANRGIGLELVRQLVLLPKPPKIVFASYRTEASLEELNKIKESANASKIVFLQMDVSKTKEVESARKIIEDTVGEEGLNLIINNAGVLKFEGFPAVTPENLELHFNVNTVGPLMVLQVMLPLLEKAAARVPGPMRASKAAVLNITSSLGSITNTGTYYPQTLAAVGYKISKAALNMAMKIVASNLKEKEILVVNMCPGWVKTDMGGKDAELNKEESVREIVQTLARLNKSNHGSFMDRFGNLYPY